MLWTFRGDPLGPDARGWTLTGEAWPDPEGTQRSEPPPLSLGVSERWRSGDPVADRLRGIAPAEVIGALVDCPGGSATLEPAVAATEILHRLDTGVAVPRSSLFPGTVVATPAGPACESRILAAPRFDTLAPVPPYDRAKEREVRTRWQARDFAPGEDACAIVLRPGAFAAARLLLLVNPAAFDAGMAVRALDADGAVVDERLPELVDAVAWATLPSRWTDPEGPWADDVLRVAEHLALLTRNNLVPVLVGLTGAAESILIGADPDRHWSAPPFYVAAVEALATAERVRHDYDASTARSDRQVLSASLGAESGDVALLEPDTTYEVTGHVVGHGVQQPRRDRRAARRDRPLLVPHRRRAARAPGPLRPGRASLRRRAPRVRRRAAPALLRHPGRRGPLRGVRRPAHRPAARRLGRSPGHRAR